MRRNNMAPLRALLLLCLLLPAGCAPPREAEPEGGYSLYFLASAGSGYGPALAAEAWTPEGRPDPGELLEALLAGPRGDALASPFPRGVTLQSWQWDREAPGNVVVVLSEQYGGLTDISLTLADYAVVLTLSQLPEVESVEIRSAGYASSYRSHQVLTAQEALLADPLDGA